MFLLPWKFRILETQTVTFVYLKVINEKKSGFFFLLLTVGLSAQQKTFSYKEKPLDFVIEDIEEIFNVRFSFNSKLLKDKVVTYNKSSELKTFLKEISFDLNLDFVFLDEENIVIKPSNIPDDYSNLLDEVVLVTEYLTSGFDQNKNDGSITMKPNRLGVLPGLTDPDVLQSLQLLPGISSPTESASNLHIRGGTPDQNLILYDGIKIYHQGHLFGMISPFNPYVVESVNVFRSGTKSEFGDRIAGVIDINSLKNVPNETSGGGGANFLHTDFYIKTPIQKDKIGLLLSARRSINDIVSLPTFNSFSDKVFQNTKIEEVNSIVEEEELTVLDDTFDFLDINAKLIFQPNQENKISISGLLVNNNLNYANIDSDNYGTRDQLDLDNRGASFFWDYTPNKKWALTSSVKYSEFNSDYRFTEIDFRVISETSSNSNQVKDFGIQFQAKHAFTNTLGIKLGYELVNYNVDYNLAFNGVNIITEDVRTKLITHNAYVETEYKTDDFYLRGGFRSSIYSEVNEFFFEPRLYLHYKLGSNLKLKASAEIKNQAISQLTSFDFNDLGVGNTIWVLTDDEQGIPVLNNQQLTFGFFYDNNGWKLDVESYYKKVKGLTSFTRGFNSGFFASEYASGNSSVFGVDVLLKKKINRFRTWLGYTYSKNDFEFPELQEGKFPGNFDQRHVISWTNTYKHNQFQFSLGWQFATGRPYSDVVNFNDDDELIFEGQNNRRLSNYHKLDASAFYDFYLDSKNKVKARLGVSIINVYNRDNEIDRSFDLRIDGDDNDFLVEQTSLGLGVTPNVVFRVYF